MCCAARGRPGEGRPQSGGRDVALRARRRAVRLRCDGEGGEREDGEGGDPSGQSKRDQDAGGEHQGLVAAVGRGRSGHALGDEPREPARRGDGGDDGQRRERREADKDGGREADGGQRENRQNHFRDLMPGQYQGEAGRERHDGFPPVDVRDTIHSRLLLRTEQLITSSLRSPLLG